MSARESIENLWDRAAPVAPLLDAYRAEVLREAAETIRSEASTVGTNDPWANGMDAAADLIDPS